MNTGRTPSSALQATVDAASGVEKIEETLDFLEEVELASEDESEEEDRKPSATDFNPRTLEETGILCLPDLVRLGRFGGQCYLEDFIVQEIMDKESYAVPASQVPIDMMADNPLNSAFALAGLHSLATNRANASGKAKEYEILTQNHREILQKLEADQDRAVADHARMEDDLVSAEMQLRIWQNTVNEKKTAFEEATKCLDEHMAIFARYRVKVARCSRLQTLAREMHTTIEVYLRWHGTELDNQRRLLPFARMQDPSELRQKLKLLNFEDAEKLGVRQLKNVYYVSTLQGYFHSMAWKNTLNGSGAIPWGALMKSAKKKPLVDAICIVLGLKTRSSPERKPVKPRGRKKAPIKASPKLAKYKCKSPANKLKMKTDEMKTLVASSTKEEIMEATLASSEDPSLGFVSALVKVKRKSLEGRTGPAGLKSPPPGGSNRPPSGS